MTAVGDRIQHYLILESLGAGGMGEVYVARDERLQRDVALKAIRRERQMLPGVRQRLLEEARALSRLEHPSICRIHDYLEDGERHYLVLELIRGRPLQQVQAEASHRSRLQWAIEIADALVAAHGAGIVHRDLKPSNVIVDESGRARVLDFGLAQAVEPARPEPPRSQPLALEGEATVAADPDATATSLRGTGPSIEGTPLYMSPEQARGEATGTASDLFSFGLVLHELFGGERAYAGVRRADFAAVVGQGRTPRVHTRDRELTRLIERLKDPAPSRRPTAVEALAVLQRIRAKPARRLRRAAAAALALAALGGGVKYTLDVRRERRQAEFRRAQAEDLIQFMLGDLREKLEPVGRLDVLSAVGDKALDYFASLGHEPLSPEDTERYGRALSQIGAVKLAAGDLDGAMSAYSESVKVYDRLVGQDPQNAAWCIGLGGARFGVGSVHWARDEYDAARREFEEYLRLAQQVVEQDPDNRKNRLELGYALTNVAAVDQALSNTDAAIERLDRAIEIKRELVQEDPEDRDAAESLANTLSWLADTAEQRGELRRALELELENLALRRRLSDQRDANSRALLTVSLARVGRLYDMLGRNSQAEAMFEEDIALSRQLVRLDPGNAEWKRGLAVSLHQLGWSRARSVPRGAAHPLLDEAASLVDELCRSDPDNASWLVDQLAIRRVLGFLAFRDGDRDTAGRLLARHEFREDVERGSDLAVELARGLVWRGELHRDTGNRELAGRNAEQALDLVGAADTPYALDARFRALNLLDRTEEARELLTRLSSFGYIPWQFRAFYDQYRVAPPVDTGADEQPQGSMSWLQTRMSTSTS